MDFDAVDESAKANEESRDAQDSYVYKTTERTVVSLYHGHFQAREIVYGQTENGQTVIQRSSQLTSLVAKGARYAFDLISYIGVESYLRGRSLKDIRLGLANHSPAINISHSSLWEQQQKFLFYLGQLHKQAIPVLRQYLADHGPVIWLLDGTIEPATPVFLGILDAATGIQLASWKIASENEDDIAGCLRQVAQWYGYPVRVLHDLSGPMIAACETALAGVPHFVCHYHLASDVGEDLYKKPQAALSKRMQAIKVQNRLREQRRGQKEWLQQQIDSPGQLVLQELLAGRDVDGLFSGTLGREVLLAFHYWILDYRSDGRRRGFPFDPYTLYLHRRLVRAGHAMDQLLSRPQVARQAPRVLFNFQKQLAEYRTDPQIVAASDLYERSFTMFTRLREALRLTAENMHLFRQPHELPTDQQEEMKTALHELRSELKQQTEDTNDPDRELAKIVLVHLDKYWSYLVPDNENDQGERWERTTNKMEKRWGVSKRNRRQTHGRSKLTRDFQALPEEYMLVPNLENETYVQLVLGGSLDALPSKLAEVSQGAGSYSAWKRRRHPQLLGRIPRRIIRDDDFIEDLTEACDRHCLSTHVAA